MTILWFVLFIIWIYLLIRVLHGRVPQPGPERMGKALWILFVIILPLLGVLFYLIFRGPKMHERDVQQAQANEQAFRVTYSSRPAAQAPPTSWKEPADLHSRAS